MKCWICGDTATTREHLLKVSDLSSYYGRVSPDRPIYFHSVTKRNVPLLSAKDKRLVCRAKICAKCNNERTQPYDRAWEVFSAYVRNNWDVISKSGKIDLSKINQGATRQLSLNVHLYFVKLFGCRIVENDVPIDIKKFSDCILNARAHDEVCMVVLETPPLTRSKVAGLTEIHAQNIGAITEKAAWIYTVGPVSIRVGYHANSSSRLAWPHVWHPNKPGKIIKPARMR